MSEGLAHAEVFKEAAGIRFGSCVHTGNSGREAPGPEHRTKSHISVASAPTTAVGCLTRVLRSVA